MSTLADFNVCRPAGWAESDEEVRRLYQRLLERQRQAVCASNSHVNSFQVDGICEADFEPMRLPEYSSSWQGQACKALHAGVCPSLRAGPLWPHS